MFRWLSHRYERLPLPPSLSLFLSLSFSLSLFSIALSLSLSLSSSRSLSLSRALFLSSLFLYHSFSRLICITLFQDWISFSCCSLPLGGSRCSHLFLCVYLPERVYLHVGLTKNTFWCARILFVCVSIYRCTSICTDMYLNICLHEYVPIPAYVNIHL